MYMSIKFVCIWEVVAGYDVKENCYYANLVWCV